MTSKEFVKEKYPNAYVGNFNNKWWVCCPAKYGLGSNLSKSRISEEDAWFEAEKYIKSRGRIN